MINIINLLEKLNNKKDSYKKLVEKSKENQELNSYLNDYKILLNHKLIINTKYNITKSFQNESEIIGLLILIESITQFMELSKEYEKVCNERLSILRKNKNKNKKNPGE